MYICIFNNYEMDLRFGLILEEIFPFAPSSLSWKIATSRLIQKKVYLLAKRTWTLFCINLELVIFQDSEFGLFFGRSFETIICFRNLLIFSKRQYHKDDFADFCGLLRKAELPLRPNLPKKQKVQIKGQQTKK